LAFWLRLANPALPLACRSLAVARSIGRYAARETRPPSRAQRARRARLDRRAPRLPPRSPPTPRVLRKHWPRQRSPPIRASGAIRRRALHGAGSLADDRASTMHALALDPANPKALKQEARVRAARIRVGRRYWEKPLATLPEGTPPQLAATARVKAPALAAEGSVGGAHECRSAPPSTSSSSVPHPGLTAAFSRVPARRSKCSKRRAPAGSSAPSSAAARLRDWSQQALTRRHHRDLRRAGIGNERVDARAPLRRRVSSWRGSSFRYRCRRRPS
jgi:hypothetical protein